MTASQNSWCGSSGWNARCGWGTGYGDYQPYPEARPQDGFYPSLRGRPLGGTPANAHAFVAKPPQIGMPAQFEPRELMKNVRGIVTWKRPHCHSLAALANGTTVHERSAFPQPATRLPGNVQLIVFVCGAYSAEFEPWSGTAVIVTLPPARVTFDGISARLPQRGTQRGAEIQAFERGDQ